MVARPRTSRPFRRNDVDALVQLLEELPRVTPSTEGPYTFVDRASDFIAVFNGASSAEQGRRVLSQIAQICDPAPKLSDADKPGTLAAKMGMRRVLAEIQLCFVAKEPMRVETRDRSENESRR